MAFSKSKGLVSIAIGYSGGNYEYTKIDQIIAADNLTLTEHGLYEFEVWQKRKVYDYYP